jgi:hypothetical protein
MFSKTIFHFIYSRYHKVLVFCIIICFYWWFFFKFHDYFSLANDQVSRVIFISSIIKDGFTSFSINPLYLVLKCFLSNKTTHEILRYQLSHPHSCIFYRILSNKAQNLCQTLYIVKNVLLISFLANYHFN